MTIQPLIPHLIGICFHFSLKKYFFRPSSNFTIFLFISNNSSEDEQGSTENQGDFNDIDNFLETEVKEETFDDDIFRFVKK